jgi:hypothetical protein
LKPDLTLNQKTVSNATKRPLNWLKVYLTDNYIYHYPSVHELLFNQHL